MRHSKTFFAIWVCLWSLGCTGSKIAPMVNVRPPAHRVNTVAMAPSGGVLAEAIAIELFNHGFRVLDTNETTQLLLRLNLDEVEVMEPTNLARLKDEGIDGYLSAKSVAGYDGLPQSASVRVNSTHTGEIVAGLTWQNGWGGRAGSIADRTMRKDLSQAAAEIARELARRLRAQGNRLARG